MLTWRLQLHSSSFFTIIQILDFFHFVRNYSLMKSGNQHSGHGSSGMGSSLHSSPLRLRSPHKTGRSPRNSSPVNPNGNLTNNMHKLDLTSGSSGIGGVSRCTDKEMSQDISVLLSGMNVGDRRYKIYLVEKKFSPYIHMITILPFELGNYNFLHFSTEGHQAVKRKLFKLPPIMSRRN